MTGSAQGNRCVGGRQHVGQTLAECAILKHSTLYATYQVTSYSKAVAVSCDERRPTLNSSGRVPTGGRIHSIHKTTNKNAACKVDYRPSNRETMYQPCSITTVLCTFKSEYVNNYKFQFNSHSIQQWDVRIYGNGHQHQHM